MTAVLLLRTVVRTRVVRSCYCTCWRDIDNGAGTQWWHYSNTRRFSDSHPQDTIGPPTKLWRYVTNRFTKFVDHYENKLEKKSPKAFNVYKTIKCVRFIASDTKDFLSVSVAIWSGRELHTFARRELEIYQEMPRSMFKITALLLLASIPFIGNGFIVIGYWFPRQLFTHHLWNDAQKVEFSQYFHTHRLSQYHHVLWAMDRQMDRHMSGESAQKMLHILNMLDHSKVPSVEQLLELKSSFETFPFSLDALPSTYYRHLGKSCGLSTRWNQLQQDGLILLHTDRAMVKEGLTSMTEAEICNACFKRGMNPYGLMKQEQLDYLKKWTDISAQLDETSISLLLHCPALLTYNSKTNIKVMKGKKYKWKRKMPA